MIAVNGYLVESGTFGDGTLKCPVAPGHILMTSEPNEIVWAYDNDAELFTLICVTRDIQNRLPEAKIILTMPYIPHARQDRNVSGRLFTLKYFAEIIPQNRIGSVHTVIGYFRNQPFVEFAGSRRNFGNCRIS